MMEFVDEVVVEGNVSADESEDDESIDVEEGEEGDEGDEEAGRQYRNKRRRVDEIINEQMICHLLNVNPPEVEEQSQVFVENDANCSEAANSDSEDDSEDNSEDENSEEGTEVREIFFSPFAFQVLREIIFFRLNIISRLR